MNRIFGAVLALASSCLVVVSAQGQALNLLPSAQALSGSDSVVVYQAGGAKLASPGQVSAYVAGQFSAPNVTTALGYTPAHAGANSDITSLSGLTTPLAVNMGGTGNATGQATSLAPGVAAANLGFTPLNKAANLSDLASVSAARVNLGAAKTTTLEQIAIANGLTIGKADDQDVMTAANNAITAAAGAGGLVITMPANTIIKSSVGPRLDNRGGYICPGAGSSGWRAVRSTSDATSNWYVTVNQTGSPPNAFATNPVLWGCGIFGGTVTYFTSFPSAWIDNQNGVNLTFAYNGSTDPNYVNNSLVGAQEPQANIGNLVIGGWGGTCLNTQGAGASIYYNVTIEGCGGYGWINNQYDSKFYGFDIGATGRSGFVCGSTGCGSDEIWLKVWYTGQRSVSSGTLLATNCGNPSAPSTADNHSAVICGGVNTIILNSQDSAGSDVVIDNTDSNILTLKCNHQGQIGNMDNVVACLSLRGTDHNTITVNYQNGQLGYYGAQPYPTATLIVQDERSVFNQFNLGYSTYNKIDILAKNAPNDQYICNLAWFDGPLDTTNQLSCNGSTRTPRTEIDDPSTGNQSFGSNMDGNVVGLITDGPLGYYPGQVTLLAQGGGGQLSGYSDTGVAATGVLTATANPHDGDWVIIGGKAWTFRNTLTSPATFQGSISGTNLTVSAVYNGTIHIGDALITTGALATVITGQTSGTTGGAGVYTVNVSQTTPATDMGISSSGMSSGVNQVQIGASAAATITNLRWAINALHPSYFVGYISGSTLTVTQPQTGLLHVGDKLTASFVQASGAAASTTAGTVITAIGSGNQGLVGTYTVNNSQTVGSSSLPVQFNGYSGTIGTDYSYGTVASVDVSAADNGGGVLTVTALAKGVGGNTIGTSNFSAGSGAAWGGSTLGGGALGAQAYNQAVTWDANGVVGIHGSPLLSSGWWTLSGTCATSITGGGGAPLASSLTIGPACTNSTIVITFADSPAPATVQQTAPHGFACHMDDMTTPADTFTETAYTTTSVTFTGTGAAGDHVVYQCQAF